MEGVEATEEVDAGECTTDPNLLLSKQTDFPTWDICTLLPLGGPINAYPKPNTFSNPDGVRGGTHNKGARNLNPLNRN